MTAEILKLKEEIHSKVDQIDNDVFLNEINQLLNLNENLEVRGVFTENQIAALNSRLQKIEDGDFFTEKEAELQLDAWLKK